MKEIEKISLDKFIETSINENENPVSYYVEYNGFVMKGLISNISEHQLWDKSGGSTIYDWHNDLDKDELIYCIKAIKEGKEICNICHKVIKGKPEYYFAGTYCEKCFHKHGLDSERDWAYSHLD